MLEKLTPEQEALMPVIRDKWIKWGTQETNKDVAIIQKNMQTLYEMANLKSVPVIVCDTQQDFIDEVCLFVKQDSVWGSVGDSVWNSVGAYYWADDLSCYDYFVQIKAIKKIAEVEKYIDLLADTSLGFVTDKICIVLCKPKVRLNTRGFLHSDEFPSVEWKDGKHSQYHLNGVKFDKELWEKVVSRKMPFADILKIKDIDQRTQAMRYGDINAFLEHVKAKKLDTFQKFTVNGGVVDYALYEIPAGDVFTETAYYAVYNCPSTAKVYMSGVPKSTSIKESMAWKSGMDVENWERMVPLVHES